MTSDQARRLKLARAAWQADAPRDDEIERAVRRLSRKMSGRAGRDPARRVLSFGLAVLVFGAALAYAASGGVGLPFIGRSSPPPDNTSPASFAAVADVERTDPKPGSARRDEARFVAPQAPAAMADTSAETRGTIAPSSALRGKRRAPKLTTPPAPAGFEVEPPVETARAEGPAAPRAPAEPGAASEPAPSASWADVSRALAERDDTSAKRALESLGSANDATTRAKARLGLAQLAASRGDCELARALANEVATSPESDSRTAARARALARRCAR